MKLDLVPDLDLDPDLLLFSSYLSLRQLSDAKTSSEDRNPKHILVL